MDNREKLDVDRCVAKVRNKTNQYSEDMLLVIFSYFGDSLLISSCTDKKVLALGGKMPFVLLLALSYVRRELRTAKYVSKMHGTH